MSSVKIRRLYLTSIIMLTLFSITFLIIPVANYVPIEYTKKVLVAIGALFWITGISGYSILIYVYRIEGKKIGKKRREKFSCFRM